MRSALLGLACLAGGCILPLGLGSPVGATTVGKGNFAGVIQVEGPNPDLVADNGPNPNAGPPRKLATAASTSLGLEGGLTDRVDFEARVDGWMVIPIGMSGGLRAQVIDGGPSGFDLGVGARGGYAGGKNSQFDFASGNQNKKVGAATVYGSAAVSAEYGRRDGIRPLLAVQVLTGYVWGDLDGGDDGPGDVIENFPITVLSLTIGVHLPILKRLTPYVTLARAFTGDPFPNRTFVAVGASVFGK